MGRYFGKAGEIFNKITYSLHTNVKDTNNFRELLSNKLEEILLRFVRKQFREGNITIEYEVIKQTDDYLKDSKLIVTGIKFE